MAKRIVYDDEKPPPSDNPWVIEQARLGWGEAGAYLRDPSQFLPHRKRRPTGRKPPRPKRRPAA